MDKHTCTNCKYFINYCYVRGSHLVSLNKGHCINRRMSKQTDSYAPDTKTCIKWEEIENKDIPVKDILTEMNKRIGELLLILGK